MKKRKTSWEKFAEDNNLSYVPEQFLRRRAKVTGKYKKYNLHLCYWTFGIEITLSTAENKTPPLIDNCSAEFIETKSINKLLIEPHLTSILGGYFRVENLGQKFFYHDIAGSRFRKNTVEEIQHLIDLLCKIANDYRKIVALGGEALPILYSALAEYKKLPNLTLQLLQDIESDTINRIAAHRNRIYCDHCLTCCREYDIVFPGLLSQIDYCYYGCRICGQSRQLFEGCVVAQLDQGMQNLRMQEKDVLYINWLIKRELFDFDEVVIVQATDEDVEKFAVRVGNDTDPLRKSRYVNMNCSIESGCKLSENTIKILNRMFGNVIVGTRI